MCDYQIFKYLEHSEKSGYAITICMFYIQMDICKLYQLKYTFFFHRKGIQIFTDQCEIYSVCKLAHPPSLLNCATNSLQLHSVIYCAKYLDT